MKYRMKMPALIVLAGLVIFSYEAAAAASDREDCIARYKKKAKCPAATYIISETCGCKYDTNCRYPNGKAIECILDNIGEARDNSAAYLMRNSCIQKNLLSGQ